ncbi:MAG: hypothetical protein HGA45_18015 [Chloroflexales bacterium]|nr:hypothetical protein [Chloroflexales bacterium]
MSVSPVFLISLVASAMLGGVGGGAFRLVAPVQAWNIFIATFLWTLIAAAGTTIARFAVERVRRGNWRRGLWLAHAQSFPLTTVFLLAAAGLGGAIGLSVVTVLYGCTLVVALTLAALGVLTSPYTR